MQPTHFRAYAATAAISSRVIPVEQPDGSRIEEKAKVAHCVHDVAVQGEVKDGLAAFSSKAEIAYVAFYLGEEGDEQVCLGRLDGPFAAGKISASFADIPEEPEGELAEGEVLVGGNTYRKID